MNPKCSYCDMRIEEPALGIMLRHCDHCIHKGCLEDMFRLKKTKCNLCEKTIAEGFDRGINAAKVKPRKVVKKNKELEETK